jgi:polyadenylation factor subunit 2
MADHSFGRLSQLARKTVDYHVSVINYLENRKFFKHESECPSIQPDPLYHSVMGVPISMNQQPSSAVTTVLMKTVTNKVKGPITCMAWNPDGKRLITGSHTGEVGLWSGLNFLHEAGMQGHDCPIRSMNFTHNENWFVTSDDRGWIKYWQTNMNVIHSFQAHQEPVRCVW